MRTIARAILVAIAELGLRLLPRRSHVVVTGWPSDEGNAVEMARELVRRDIPVVWLDAPTAARLEHLGFGAADRGFRRVAKRSISGFLAFLTARTVFFTHGLYGNPRPVAGKTIVNLWHGDGPKSQQLTGVNGRPPVPATVVVGGSGVFARARSIMLGTPVENTIVTGFPRSVQLFHEPDPSRLVKLGIDPSRPFVLWMPTYRRSTGVGLVGEWNETAGSDESALAATFRRTIESIADGVQVVVKMHPLDAVRFESDRVVHVSDGQIADAGVSLYSLVGASAGLITDYSSVWTEYLLLDRPIGFLAPDEEAYLAGRGLQPEGVMDMLPGDKLDSPERIARFVAEVNTGAPSTAVLRATARETFEITSERDPAAALLARLEGFGGASGVRDE